MNKLDPISYINVRDILSDEELAVLHQLFFNQNFDSDLATKADPGPNRSLVHNSDTPEFHRNTPLSILSD